jgi:hypothetical protein
MHKSMFLTEDEMKNQGNPSNWRKGVAPIQMRDIFSSTRTPENNRIFNYNTPSRSNTAKPFHFKRNGPRGPLQGSADIHPRPTIYVPPPKVEETIPSYVPKTP